MKATDIQEYIDMASRRKWWVIIPLLFALLGALAYIMITPKIYEAKAQILVQSQKVPENIVQPMISSAIEDRVVMIQQQVTSRTNLEKIIQQYGLYGSPGADILPEEKVQLFREAIKIEAVYWDIDPSSRDRRGREEISAFTISFRYKDAGKAAEVTNALASNFVTENLKMREAQVLGTSSFLFDELASVEEQLAKKEEELKQYREKYMGGLPEQLDTNLKILERLQQQLDQLNNKLREAENRKILIKEQIASSMVLSANGEPRPKDIRALRQELASLELKYSENHPDVIMLRKMIAKVEAEMSKMETNLAEGDVLLEGWMKR